MNCCYDFYENLNIKKAPNINVWGFLEYLNEWWLEAGSNCRHTDFQSVALPTELSSRLR